MADEPAGCESGHQHLKRPHAPVARGCDRHSPPHETEREQHQRNPLRPILEMAQQQQFCSGRERASKEEGEEHGPSTADGDGLYHFLFANAPSILNCPPP
jgi:hypothetical protein